MEIRTDPFQKEKGCSRLTQRSSILTTITIYYFNILICNTVTIEIDGYSYIKEIK